MEEPLPFSRLRALVHLGILRPFLKIFFGMGVEGRENLEGLDQFILVANHNSHLDTAFLFQLLPSKHLSRTHPLAALDYFGKTKLLFGLAQLLFQPIWIHRGKRDRDPLKGMRDRLQQGHSVIIFPEGTRGEPGVMAPFRTGVGRLAEEFKDIPLVPVYLAGADRAWPKSSALPLPMWARAVVGRPQMAQGNRRDTTQVLQEMILELAGADTAGRHHRSYRPSVIPTLAVLGIDGSGKSTLSRRLAQELSEKGKVCQVSDSVVLFEGGKPQEIQTLVTERIREAIGRRAKTAKSLKSYKVPKLAELLLRDHMVGQIKRWYGPDLIITDGSPLLNMTAWARLYREEEPEDALLSSAMGLLSGKREGGADDPVFQSFPELKSMQRLHLTHLHCPDGVLFLDVDPSISVERIQGRGEARQVHETTEKLEKLRAGYRSVCRFLEPDWQVPARVLDGHQGLEEVMASGMEALREMKVIPERLLPLGPVVEEDEFGPAMEANDE